MVLDARRYTFAIVISTTATSQRPGRALPTDGGLELGGSPPVRLAAGQQYEAPSPHLTGAVDVTLSAPGPLRWTPGEAPSGKLLRGLHHHFTSVSGGNCTPGDVRDPPSPAPHAMLTPGFNLQQMVAF